MNVETLEKIRVPVVLRIAHLALTNTGLSMRLGVASDGSAQQPSSLGGAAKPRFFYAHHDRSRHFG